LLFVVSMEAAIEFDTMPHLVQETCGSLSPHVTGCVYRKLNVYAEE
jgi:hypothetical protein